MSALLLGTIALLTLGVITTLLQLLTWPSLPLEIFTSMQYMFSILYYFEPAFPVNQALTIFMWVFQIEFLLFMVRLALRLSFWIRGTDLQR